MSVAHTWRGRHGPLLIAEIGGNHEGDFEAAQRLTDLAIQSGADVVKFQVYTGSTLVSPVESPDRHAHFKRFELKPEQHRALARRVRDAGLRYNASVWDPDVLDWLDPYLDFYKIGSGDLTARPILAAHAERGKPMLLSTGLATLAEIVDAVAYIQQVNASYCEPGQLALMQCTSMYPTDDAEVNLRAMVSIERATGMVVGYSDHTRDGLALRVAAARGAEVLEFHFTDQPVGRSFRDHAISLTCEEVQALAVDVARIRQLLGSELKAPTPGEQATGHVRSFRRAVYCRRALRAGEVLQASDLVVLRPNHGVDARQFEQIIGRRVRGDTPAFAAIELEGE